MRSLTPRRLSTRPSSNLTRDLDLRTYLPGLPARSRTHSRPQANTLDVAARARIYRSRQDTQEVPLPYYNPNNRTRVGTDGFRV